MCRKYDNINPLKRNSQFGCKLSSRQWAIPDNQQSCNVHLLVRSLALGRKNTLAIPDNQQSCDVHLGLHLLIRILAFGRKIPLRRDESLNRFSFAVKIKVAQARNSKFNKSPKTPPYPPRILTYVRATEPRSTFRGIIYPFKSPF